MGIVFAVQYVGTATAVAITALRRAEFATVCLLKQVPILLAAVFVLGAAGVRHECTPPESSLG